MPKPAALRTRAAGRRRRRLIDHPHRDNVGDAVVVQLCVDIVIGSERDQHRSRVASGRGGQQRTAAADSRSTTVTARTGAAAAAPTMVVAATAAAAAVGAAGTSCREPDRNRPSNSHLNSHRVGATADATTGVCFHSHSTTQRPAMTAEILSSVWRSGSLRPCSPNNFTGFEVQTGRGCEGCHQWSQHQNAAGIWRSASARG